MPLSKLSSNSFNTQANLTSLSIGTAANRALGGSGNTTTIATENPGLVTIAKPYDGGATTIRFTSNPSGYGNDFYHSIAHGAGSGFNIYAGGYQSHIDNQTYTSNNSNTMMYFGGSTSDFNVQLYTGTQQAAANNTYIGNKSYVRQLLAFSIGSFGNIKTPACEYTTLGTSSWATTLAGDSGGQVPFQAFQCRAFCYFNGITNAVVRGANISSITDQGTGLYRANFSSNMPDANYTVVTAGQHNGYGGAALGTGPGSAAGDNTTSYVSLECRNYTNSNNEPNALYFAVFR
jgi:hypothetical protein